MIGKQLGSISQPWGLTMPPPPPTKDLRQPSVYRQMPARNADCWQLKAKLLFSKRLLRVTVYVSPLYQ